MFGSFSSELSIPNSETVLWLRTPEPLGPILALVSLADYSRSLQSFSLFLTMFLDVWLTFPLVRTLSFGFFGGFSSAEADLVVLHVSSCSSAFDSSWPDVDPSRSYKEMQFTL